MPGARIDAPEHPQRQVLRHKTLDKGHGRIETRCRIAVGELDWRPGLKARWIPMLEGRRARRFAAIVGGELQVFRTKSCLGVRCGAKLHRITNTQNPTDAGRMTSENSSSPLQGTLFWLSTDPDDDLDAELTALSHCVGAIVTETLSMSQRQEALGLLCQRAQDVCDRFRPGLLTCALPTPIELRAQASLLIDALLEISALLRDLYDDMRHRKLWTRNTDLSELCNLSLGVLGETYLLNILLGAPAPFSLWQRIHDAWISSGQYERLRSDAADPQPSEANLLYKRLLTMAVSQTESLTVREQQWLFDYLETVGGDLALSLAALPPETSNYWFDPNQDMAPQACVRRAPEKGREAVYFRLEEIVHRIGVQILWLEKGLLDLDVSARQSGESEILEVGSGILPLGLTPIEILSLLRRLREHWSSPPERAELRSRQHYTVQVCAGLKNIWAMGRNAPVMIDEWTVYNESPGGYAILCVGGVHRSLLAGAVLALRREASQEWTLSVVRWVRTDSPQQIELGLQVLGQGFTPVLICFHGNDTMTPGLMIRRGSPARGEQAIVTESGTYVSNRFVMVHEAAGNVYLAQGSALGLDMQTAMIELFQFEIDLYAK
ncbi:MAG: hypothetical protein LBR95_08105 [Azoarcus sp.]|nr:hypothetical protein [Azoarcus sp.]